MFRLLGKEPTRVEDELVSVEVHHGQPEQLTPDAAVPIVLLHEVGTQLDDALPDKGQTSSHHIPTYKDHKQASQILTEILGHEEEDLVVEFLTSRIVVVGEEIAVLFPRKSHQLNQLMGSGGDHLFVVFFGSLVEFVPYAVAGIGSFPGTPARLGQLGRKHLGDSGWSRLNYLHLDGFARHGRDLTP